MEPQTLLPAVMAERVNEAGGDRLVKSNILYIDGRNLHQSRILHYYPIGRNEEKADEGLADDSNVSLLSRYVREILVFLCYSDSRHYARKFGVPVEDYKKRLSNYLESGCTVGLHQTPYPIEQTIWYVVKRQYRFQADSLYNQLEDVCVSVLNLSLVEVPAESPSLGPDVLLASLDEYHSRLFANYYKWCDYLGAAPFPWKCPPWLEDSYCADDGSKGCNLTSECENLQEEGPDKLWTTRTRQEMQKMMFEVAMFKLLWSESANLRHTPELLCWLFHWFCTAWDKDFKPEEGFTDLIRDVVQRIRDEQWYLASALRTPDHNARLLYDDFNELFWDRRCLEILNRPAVDGEFQGKDIQNGDPAVQRLARTASSSELQLENPPNPKDPCKNGSPSGYLVSRESLNAVIAELSYASKPGSGIKTFTEERTYAQRVPFYVQVLRNFWRVFAWHVTTFAAILLLYAVLDEESSYSVKKQWAVMTLAAALSYGMLPVFELALANYRAVARQRCRHFPWRRLAVHAVRMGFALFALVTVIVEGLDSPRMQWNGSLSMPYWIFFVVHWGHYFLFLRVRDRMPFFILLWRSKWLASLSRPSTFTGSVPLLAENFTQVLKYSLFWVLAMAAKALYWLYVILPPMVAASKHVDYVSCRPVYISSVAFWPGYLPAILQGFIWVPAFLIWLFDMQIFFLLFGALYGSIDGYIRRVGYITNCRKIQQRLLPMLPLTAIFRDPADVQKINKPSFLEMPSRPLQPNGVPVQKRASKADRYCSRQTFLRQSAAGTAFLPAPSLAFPRASNDLRRASAQYANISDPYKKMVPQMRARTLIQPELHNEWRREDFSDMEAIKRFGFLWNEIIQSWRNEDIICYSEQEKLEFNELPNILYETHSLADLYLECGRATVDWRHSVVRHPVFVYCNELTAFVKHCEDFHYQASGDMLRLCSKEALAKTFYREYLSCDPNSKDPRLERSMHLQACQEIAEALKLYLARYFIEGPQLVHAMREMWSWVDSDPTRLLWLNLQGLKTLAKALQNAFSLAQRTCFWKPSDAEKTTKANADLKKALMAMIMLPSSEPEELGGSNIPVTVQNYVKSVGVCFGSHSLADDMPSILPAPLRRAEVAVMIEQLEVTLHHTSLLLLSNEGEGAPTSAGDLPLLPDELAEMRALHAQLGQAEAAFVLGDNGSEDAKYLDKEPKDAARIASTEHAVKLFFRRAARILETDEPSFKCAEAQRRFGTFINSLLMKIPETPLVRNMVSMMTLTPYYREDARLDLQDLEKRTDEGVCKMDLLRSLHPVEFDNFIERVDRDRDMFTIRQEIEDRVTDSPERRKLALQDIRAQMQQCGLLHRYDRFCEMLQEWASYRGQVLMRTVYGIMYYEQAVKMQAYLEETPPEEIHLCRDSNRLDETQRDIIRSPEAALWWEVVSYAPPYEVKQSTRELAQLKYQYVVAAQEFGTDMGAQMPQNGCEPSPALRAQLLRKVALCKLLVRYPSLRIATLEPERSLEGRPTGHKLSVLYRLTADIDPVGERIIAPAAPILTPVTAGGRLVRPGEGEVKPATIPALLVPAPRIPVCAPGANMGPGSTTTIKPRSGNSSSGENQSAGGRSNISNKPATNSAAVEELGASAGALHEDITDMNKHQASGGILKPAPNSLICSSVVEGTRHLLGQGFPNSGWRAKPSSSSSKEDQDSYSLAAQQPAPGKQETAGTFLASQTTSGGDGGGAKNPRGGDFESKIARAIHWLYQKKHRDRSLFAARAQSALRYTASSQRDKNLLPYGHSDAKNESGPLEKVTGGRLKGTLLSMLCQDPSDELLEDAVAEAAQHDASPTEMNGPEQKVERFKTLKTGSFVGCLSESVCVKERQTPIQLKKAALHSTSPCTPVLRGQSIYRSKIWTEGSKEGEELSGRVAQRAPSYAGIESPQHKTQSADKPLQPHDVLPIGFIPTPTLLEAQLARDLARDCVSTGAPAARGEVSQLLAVVRNNCNVHDERIGNGEGELATYKCYSSRPDALQAHQDCAKVSKSPEAYFDLKRSFSRRHSIITLHPRHDDALLWSSLPTMIPEREDHTCNAAICPDSCRANFAGGEAKAHDIGSSAEETYVGQSGYHARQKLLRQEAWHTAECHVSPRAAGPSNAEGNAEEQWCGAEAAARGRETLRHVSAAAPQRSNSLGALKERGLPSMKERVAFFEERLSRHQARVEAEALNLARQSRSTHRRDMSWLSRRGPLRLEAIYKIRLPLIMDDSGTPWARAPIIGPGKPENQNHAIAFSRMDTMQVMDMNMESYLEEAIKVRNLLQEFLLNARMRILGFREHIFTENVSSLASYMALQENLFTTTNQRLYFAPLRVRMHYGHPDIFDRYFVQTCGSCSKASNGINLSEDIFAGFNCTARGYCVHHADYIQCGKGRDVGLQQVVMFEKKVAGGNGEQLLSRDLNRLVSNMDFFRLLSLWFTGPGFFLNSVILVLAAYVCLYAKCFLAFAKHNYSGPIESALEYVLTPTTYVQFQLGMLLVLPLIPWLFLEKGLISAMRKLVDLISKFSVTYYNFMTCTKASVIDHVLIYGGAKYQETGRGFVIERATLKDIWMCFYFTHFSIGLEMFLLLAIYATYAGLSASLYFLDTWPVLLMATSIILVPFIFNPLGFYYPRLRQDFRNWNAWMSSRELGVPKESWVSWWRGEMEQRCNIVWHHQVIIVTRLLRFPLLAAGIISCVATSIRSADVDCALYLVAASGLFVTMKSFLGDLQIVSPSAKAWISLVLVTGTVTFVFWLVLTKRVSLASLFISFFALCVFIYGALEVAFAVLGRWAVRSDMFSDVVRAYHRCAGLCTFAPLLLLSAVTTSVHHLQTRILFNPTFVSIVKSGLVQREQVEKSGHGHN